MSNPEGLVRLEELRKFPERPESEFEWEDLLLRLEIMPRALRVELERTKTDDAPPILSELNDREMTVQRLLEEVAFTADPLHSSTSEPDRQGPATSSSAGGMSAPGIASPTLASGPWGGSDVERFVRLRGRNFAMLQRRGIDVWNWRIRIERPGDATVFQLLLLLTRDDVETLSRLRKARTP